MKKLIPILNNPGCREEAALEIAKLRRKGVRCHLKERPGRGCNYIEVVIEDGTKATLRELRTYSTS